MHTHIHSRSDTNNYSEDRVHQRSFLLQQRTVKKLFKLVDIITKVHIDF